MFGNVLFCWCRLKRVYRPVVKSWTCWENLWNFEGRSCLQTVRLLTCWNENFKMCNRPLLCRCNIPVFSLFENNKMEANILLPCRLSVGALLLQVIFCFDKYDTRFILDWILFSQQTKVVFFFFENRLNCCFVEFLFREFLVKFKNFSREAFIRNFFETLILEYLKVSNHYFVF